MYLFHYFSSLPFLNFLLRDPQDDVPFAKVLYESMRFTKSLYNSLNDNGLIVFQVGASPDSDSGPDESTDQMKASLQTNLVKSGFHSIHLYEEVSLIKICNSFYKINCTICMHLFILLYLHISLLAN